MTKQPLFLASAPSAEVPNGPYSQAQPPVGPCPSGAELGDRNRGVTGVSGLKSPCTRVLGCGCSTGQLLGATRPSVWVV